MPNHSRFRLLLAAGLLAVPALSGTTTDVRADGFHSPAEAAQTIDQLLKEGEFEIALSLAAERLTAVRREFGPAAPETAHALASVAQCQAGLEQAAAAVSTYLEVIAILAKLPDTDLRSKIVHRGAWHALGQLYEDSGRPRESIGARLEVLKLLDTQGRDAYSAVLTWMEIGATYMEIGERRAAEDAYLQGVKATAFVPGKNRWLPLFIYRHLAYLYRFEERYKKSEAVLEEGLAQMKAIYAQDNEYTVLFYEALGWTYFYQFRYDEARYMADLALAFYKMAGLAESESSVRAMSLKARILTEPAYNASSYSSHEALALLVDALDIQEAETGDKSLPYAEILFDLAYHHLKQRNFVMAEDYSRRAVAIYEATLGTSALGTGTAQQYLGQALKGQQRFADALFFAERAYAIQRGELPPYHHALGESLSLLSELYKELGQQDAYQANRQEIATFYEERAKFMSGG